MSICVFFGAGAEIPFGISGGKDFAKGVLGIGKEELNTAIKAYYNDKKNDLVEWYPRYAHWDWKYEKLLDAAVKKEILESQHLLRDVNDYENEVKRRYEEIIKKEKEDEIIAKYTSYMGLLDEKFHTLIAPKALGPKKFWCVVECYTRAYMILAAEMLYGTVEKIGVKEYEDILRNPVQTIQRLNDACNQERFQKRSYYSILRSKNNVRVVTTNYTPCCKQITGYGQEKIAYVHGRFGQFENPYNWSVVDVNDAHSETAFEKGHVYFPYISIQSGIKPIVEESQILEYAKMIQAFSESDRIVIVGYRINGDDNHINAMIRSCIKRGKDVVYLAFNGEPSRMQIIQRLRLNERESEKLSWKAMGITDSFELFEKELA